jgi:hypothetical protein
MAATGTTLPTLAQLAASSDPNFQQALPIIEALSKRPGLFRRLGREEANFGILHKTSIRTGLPTAAYRMFNLGLDPSNGSEVPISFPVSKLGTLGQVDAELIKIAPNREKFVGGKMAGHLEALVQKLSFEMFYGTAATPEGIVGLSAMYSSTSAENGQNVIDAGGSDQSDNASIWLINSGPNAKALYPRGTAAGIEREPLGYETSENLGGAGKVGRVWREMLHVGAGVAVEDWRDVVRVASIDVSALLAESNDADLIKLGRKAKHRMLSRPMYDRFWVMHPTIWEAIENQRDDKQVAGGGVSKATIDGVEVPTFHGYPVEIDDNLVLTEAPV